MEVEGLLKAIASDFMKLAIVKKTKANDQDPTDVQQNVPTPDVSWISASPFEIEANEKQEEVEMFLRICKDFLIETILQLKSRFDLNAEYHDIVQCLHPFSANKSQPSFTGNHLRETSLS